MVSTGGTAQLSHALVTVMYKKEPKTDENGNLIFSKSGLMLFSGIMLIIIFSLCFIFAGFLLSDFIKENNITGGMKVLVYIAWYLASGLMTFLGIAMIARFAKGKIIVSKSFIKAQYVFSSKTINFNELTEIKFTNRSLFIFKSSTSKIIFGSFTTGLIPMKNFIDENFKKDICEKALNKAEKMLKRNHI